MRVALYIRVSTEEQKIHGLSIDAQTEALDAWAKSQHAQVVGHYVDAGISARKKAYHRPALQRLLDDVRAGKVDVIVFTKLDRWFRNIAEYYKVQEILEAYNVNWRTIQEDYDTSTASGRLKINIMLSVAQDEADRTGERIKAVFDSKVLRNEPISGKVPLGYKIEDKHMVIDTDTAPIAQDIFRQYVACRSVGALRKYVISKYGLIYSHTGLKMFLQNERYIGRAHGQDEFCAPLIDRSTFDIAQAAIAERAQRNSQARAKRIYIFTGIVFCAECGNRLSAHTVAGQYIYYRCTRHEKLQLCPHNKRTSEAMLEEWLLENILAQFRKFNAQIEKAKHTRPEIDAAKIKRKMEKLKDLYLNDLIDRAAYEADYIALRDALAGDNEIPIPAPVNLSAMRDALSEYKLFTREEQKEFWSRTVKKIIITNDEVISVIPVSPYKH